MESQHLLNKEELAERLRVYPATVMKWEKEGRIPSIRVSPRVIRFDFKEVLEALKKRRIRKSSDDGS